MATRCPGCMKLKNSSPVCEHCGYNENVPNYSHQLPVGTRLRGQYTVGKVLGQGGFGITYIGWDDNLDIPLAIKEYYPSGIVSRDNSYSLEVASTGYNTEIFQHNRERFMREARAMAKLTNVPGIVKIYNYFPENNTAYITMEYVKGTDLKRYIKMQGRPLTPRETFAVLRPVMDALSRVHEAGLVHRDISPDNIMIQSDGQAKLLDFGAVREVKDADVAKNLSRSTESILKHGYAPIEQYQRRGNLGPWTDVYALCATVYYCLTQDVPPDAPERMIEMAEVEWDKIEGLTEAQIRVFRHGMAILPKDRIISIDQLRQELFPPEPEPEPMVEVPKEVSRPRSVWEKDAQPTVMMLTPQKPEELIPVAPPEPERPSRQEQLKRRQEQRRLEAERQEAERQEKRRQEAQRREQERLEAERLEKEKQEKLRLERQRREAARLEAQRQEKERKERQKQEQLRLEQEEKERKRQEKERRDREKQEQLRREQEAQERQKREQERLEAKQKRQQVKKKSPASVLAVLLVMVFVAVAGFFLMRREDVKIQDIPVGVPVETVSDGGDISAGKPILDLRNAASEITLWTYPIGGWGNEETVAPLLAAFEAETGIKVNVKFQTYVDGDDAVNSAIEAGTAPDLILEGPERLVATWGKRGVMVDLADLLDETDRAEIYPGALGACYGQSGELYEYPLVMTAHCMAINKTVFEAAGAMQYLDEKTHTWKSTEAFFSAIEAVYHHTGQTVGTVYCAGQGGDQGTRALVNNLYSGTFTNPEHTAYTWDSAENIEALTALVDCEGISFDSSITGGDEIALFYNGALNVAFCWNIAQQINPNAANNGAGRTRNGDEIMFVAFPSNGEPSLCGNIWGFGVFNNGDEARITAAKIFVKYMCDSNMTASAVTAAKYFAVRDMAEGVDLTDVWEDDPIMDEYRILMPMLGDYYPITPGWSEARTNWWNMLQDIGDGMDVAQTAAKYSAQINEMIR